VATRQAQIEIANCWNFDVVMPQQASADYPEEAQRHIYSRLAQFAGVDALLVGHGDRSDLLGRKREAGETRKALDENVETMGAVIGIVDVCGHSPCSIDLLER